MRNKSSPAAANTGAALHSQAPLSRLLMVAFIFTGMLFLSSAAVFLVVGGIVFADGLGDFLTTPIGFKGIHAVGAMAWLGQALPFVILASIASGVLSIGFFKLMDLMGSRPPDGPQHYRTD